MFGLRLKHAQRYQEILTALLRNGLGFLIKDMGLAVFLQRQNARMPKPGMMARSIRERIRFVLEDLGPLIKSITCQYG